MSPALRMPRMLATASRCFPAPTRHAAVRVGPTTFGAPQPVRRLLSGRLFASAPNGNGNGGARGAYTTTAAAPRGGASGAKTTTTKTHNHGAEQPTELVFEPFEEVRGPLDIVRGSEGHDISLAREHDYTNALEDAVNAQINVELTISHIYHSLYAYMDRDNVALRGLARYFRKQSKDERKHAERIIDFQNERGGRVRLSHIPAPLSDFDDAQKGDALNAMELALSLEKLNYNKLRSLDKLATEAEDFRLADFVDELLADQTEDVKRAADYVSQLRRVGKGHGTWAWDQQLYDEYD